MRLVVDTNRIIAALVRGFTARKILLSGNFELITIGLAKEEIEEHRAEILDILLGAEPSACGLTLAAARARIP